MEKTIDIRSDVSEVLSCVRSNLDEIINYGNKGVDIVFPILKIINKLSLAASGVDINLYSSITDIITGKTPVPCSPRVMACKKYREITGGSLCEAVDYVDAVAFNNGILWGKYNTENQNV